MAGIWLRAPRIVARSAPRADDAVTIAIWGAVIILILVAAWVVLAWLRRRLRQGPEQTSPTLWTLDGLRQLHASGLVSDEEFGRLRKKLLGQLEAGVEGQPATDEPTAGPAGPPAAGPESQGGEDHAQPGGSDMKAGPTNGR